MPLLYVKMLNALLQLLYGNLPNEVIWTANINFCRRIADLLQND
jgi:hypothetical protein